MDGAAAYAAASGFERGYYARAASTARSHPLGLNLSDPAVPRAHVLNMLWVTVASAAPRAVLEALEETQGHLAHRKAEVSVDRLGAELAPAMRDAGYSATRLAWMALRRPLDRRSLVGMARETDAPPHAAVEAATTEECPLTRPIVVARQLALARARLRAAVRTRFFVGRSEGVDASHATLLTDGVVAQLEDVATLAAFRGRGLARAVCSTAVLAAPTGALVFVVAEADDWPRQLYGKLGFDAVGTSWAFVRDPA